MNEMPLNKYVAYAGISSRRSAVNIIKGGQVSVNGKKIYEPGFKVTPEDEVEVRGKKISNKKKLVYILLNKPLNTITTTDDPEGRDTVMKLVKGATRERIYPIGRLDRNTTGVLILTNDGNLTQKLSHPKFEVPKTYDVILDKPLTKRHLHAIAEGIDLDDGRISADSLLYTNPDKKNYLSISIHSGRNRIVRRIFQHLGYEVIKLDRVEFAGINKDDLDKGRWRYLIKEEVEKLKSSKV